MRCLKVLSIAAVVALTACGPNESQKQKLAEKKRIECLDQFCEGDIEPKRDVATETALKLHGQWYIAPKRYYSTGKNGGGFYWPSRHPMFEDGDYPEGGQDFPEKAIEIFLTGRQRWGDPNALTPWEGAGWEGRFAELQQQGLRIERQQLRPELERIRFFDSQGLKYRHEYFLATLQRRVRGNGPPGIACDSQTDTNPKARPGCSGGMYWQEDVYADFRFHAQHAADWPAIHQEVVRVLSLAKKVNP